MNKNIKIIKTSLWIFLMLISLSGETCKIRHLIIYMLLSSYSKTKTVLSTVSLYIEQKTLNIWHTETVYDVPMLLDWSFNIQRNFDWDCTLFLLEQ